MKERIKARELAYCGLFGAGAVMLPFLFHVLHLGHIFMPMYLPLVALAFFVRPIPAATTAAITPLLSGAVTGMPPFFPPVAVFMALELGLMCSIIAWVKTKYPRSNEWILLAPVLLLGRAVHVGMIYGFSLAIDLPAKFMAGISFLSGWPGVILMIIVVPLIARARRMVPKRLASEKGITNER